MLVNLTHNFYLKMELYTGYIVQKDETNPYSVWIPAKNGGITFKHFTNFGANASEFSVIDLTQCQAAAEKCYIVIEPTAQGDYWYDTDSGYATVEENNPNPSRDTIPNIKDTKEIGNRYSAPNEGDTVFSVHSSPAVHGLQTFLPSTSSGTTINTYANMPGGRHTTLDIGTRVLVAFPDNRSIGYIIGQIPGADKTASVIRNSI